MPSQANQQHQEEERKTKGIRSKQRRPAVEHMPVRPENKKITKAEFQSFRQKFAKGKAAADKARAEVMAENEDAGDPEADKARQKAQDKVNKVKGELKALQADLSKDPDNKKLPKQIQKLQEKLEKAENELADLEPEGGEGGGE